MVSLNNLCVARDLIHNDGAVHIKGFLAEPEKYCNWTHVEDALMRADMGWELINSDGTKKELGMYKPYWAPTPDFEKEVIWQHLINGLGFVIVGYSRSNQHIRQLCAEVEREFNVNCCTHVYGGRGLGGSFKCHYDHFSNLIIQTKGTTPWKVYKNRATSMYHSRNELDHNEDEMVIDWQGDMEPGDLLYIPDRAFHKASPNSERLSMSIPCMPTIYNSEHYDRRNYTFPRIESTEGTGSSTSS